MQVLDILFFYLAVLFEALKGYLKLSCGEVSRIEKLNGVPIANQRKMVVLG